ncbi:MAG: helix-turn-helix domain-containing protein, partial [Candidatus Omnitrophica bacterium]|nr:helix-turn-helix domain-containing protein [Candidatus Omnitrophota bacterium]
MNTTNNNKSENSALQLLQDIKSGTTDPKLLDKQTRQQCIETLLGEGYSCSQIAQIFKRSEKTISRDLGDIRQKNSLSPNIQFAKETVGELATKARIHSSYLMRLARDKDSPTGSKAEAEFLAWR